MTWVGVYRCTRWVLYCKKQLELQRLGRAPYGVATLPIAPTTDVVVHLLQRYI
jgi:hypothetical protein